MAFGTNTLPTTSVGCGFTAEADIEPRVGAGGYSFRKFLTKALTVERAAKVHRVPLKEFLTTIRTAVGQMPSS